GLHRWAHHKESVRPGSPAVLALALGPSALINAFVGYALAELSGHRPGGMILATIAYGAHLWVDDAQLTRRWQEPFLRIGRWVMPLCLLAGWALRVADHTRGHLLALAYALLSGNVMAEALPHETPGEPQTRYRFFVGGALVFAGLVLLTYWFD